MEDDRCNPLKWRHFSKPNNMKEKEINNNFHKVKKKKDLKAEWMDKITYTSILKLIRVNEWNIGLVWKEKSYDNNGNHDDTDIDMKQLMFETTIIHEERVHDVVPRELRWMTPLLNFLLATTSLDKSTLDDSALLIPTLSDNQLEILYEKFTVLDARDWIKSKRPWNLQALYEMELSDLSLRQV